MPPIISFIARPNHGKTTFLEKLLPELKTRGLKVGVVKHHAHEFEFDKKGKDTWRHKRAKAHGVILSSPTGLGLVTDVKGDLPLVEIVSRYFYDLDLVLTEGYKTENFPKIEICRQAISTTPLANPDKNWLAYITDFDLPTTLPCFGLDSVKEVSDFIINKFISNSENGTKVVVNGQEIKLNRFVEEFIRLSIIGMTKSLKGCAKPSEITIAIKNKNDGK